MRFTNQGKINFGISVELSAIKQNSYWQGAREWGSNTLKNKGNINDLWRMAKIHNFFFSTSLTWKNCVTYLLRNNSFLIFNSIAQFRSGCYIQFYAKRTTVLLTINTLTHTHTQIHTRDGKGKKNEMNKILILIYSHTHSRRVLFTYYYFLFVTFNDSKLHAQWEWNTELKWNENWAIELYTKIVPDMWNEANGAQIPFDFKNLCCIKMCKWTESSWKRQKENVRNVVSRVDTFWNANRK